MSGPYSIEKKAQLAAAIDAALGTDESKDTTSAAVDLILGWMSAAAQRIVTLEGQVATLQAQMTKVIAGG